MGAQVTFVLVEKRPKRHTYPQAHSLNREVLPMTPSLLAFKTSLLNASLATSTSITFPTPRLHPSSNAAISPLAPSCCALLIPSTSSVCLLTSASSPSMPLSMSSSWLFPTNHAFFPYRSSSASACCLDAKYVDDAYAFRRASLHFRKISGRSSSEWGEVAGGGFEGFVAREVDGCEGLLGVGGDAVVLLLDQGGE